MRTLRSMLAIGLLIAVLVLTGSWGLTHFAVAPVTAQNAASPEASAPAAETPAAEESAVDVVKAVGNTVVTVVNEQLFQGFDTAQPVGSGTGFIIDKDGHIVTNWHVVQGGQQFLVILADGERRPATLIGSDSLSDLAVVQIEGDLPAIASFGDSDALEVGETVLAIGSPLGTFTNTVTEGIVSALGRDLPQSNYNNLIQHDAAINPGNSGGPLFNLHGEVVGVNTLGLSNQGGQSIQGLFFALPSNQVQTIVERLIKNGSVVYPFFGVTYQTINWQNAAQANLPVENGIYVSDVSAGSPAATAGLLPGDIVTAIDGVKIDATHAFSAILFTHQPGDTVKVDLIRNGKDMTVSLTLSKRPDNT